MPPRPDEPASSTVPGGIRIRLKVRPKARHSRIEGLSPGPDGNALSIAVGAPPEDGKANAAVIALLASAFGVAKSAVSVVSGATSRRKLVEIQGDPAALAGGLAAIVGNLNAKDLIDHE